MLKIVKCTATFIFCWVTCDINIVLLFCMVYVINHDHFFQLYILHCLLVRLNKNYVLHIVIDYVTLCYIFATIYHCVLFK